MRFLLDVDDVLAHLTAHVYLVSGTPKDILKQDSWDFLRALPEREQYLVKFFMKFPEFWENLPVLAGAEEGVKAIRDAGHELFCVTSPWGDCREWGAARRVWLEKHFQVDHHDIVITGSKFLIQGDVFIDDKFLNVSKWREHNPQGLGLLYRAPYVQNKHPGWGAPTFVWSEIHTLLESLDVA